MNERVADPWEEPEEPTFQPVSLTNLRVPQPVKDSWRGNLTLAHYEELRRLVDLGQERALDKFIRETPPIWSAYLEQHRTGNHGAVVTDQPQIATKLGTVDKGMIPDYLIASRNSDGLRYFVVELKAPNARVFEDQSGWRLTDVANRGLIQLLKYIDFCAEFQSTLREMYGFRDLREPTGVLVIGRAAEFDNSKQARKLKAAWNRSSPRIEIRTYDSLTDSVGEEVERYKTATLGVRDSSAMEERLARDQDDWS